MYDVPLVRVPLTAPVVLMVAVLTWLAVTSVTNSVKLSFVGVVVRIAGRNNSSAVTITPRSKTQSRQRGGRWPPAGLGNPNWLAWVRPGWRWASHCLQGW